MHTLSNELSATFSVVREPAGSDPDSDELTYTWDFGDGSKPVQGRTPTHTNKKKGRYNVKLTVTDGFGAKTLLDRPGPEVIHSDHLNARVPYWLPAVLTAVPPFVTGLSAVSAPPPQPASAITAANASPG